MWFCWLKSIRPDCFLLSCPPELWFFPFWHCILAFWAKMFRLLACVADLFRLLVWAILTKMICFVVVGTAGHSALKHESCADIITYVEIRREFTVQLEGNQAFASHHSQVVLHVFVFKTFHFGELGQGYSNFTIRNIGWDELN